MGHAWNLNEREATPEAVFQNRRRWLKQAGIGGALVAGGAAGGLWWYYFGASDEEVLAHGHDGTQFSAGYPAPRNLHFAELDRPLTAESAAARYCNFYEFTSTKMVWRYVDQFRPHPWKLEVAGLVARPSIFDMDDIVRAFVLEERLYRHRCVEAWAMAIPWTGFPLAQLLQKVQPLDAARYVRFVSFQRPDEAGHQRNTSLPWPYFEGLTLAEAMNGVTFLATGMYGHPLLKQHGAPIRLVVPWKYGFKSAKSIVRIELTADRPATFWNTLAPQEYDFEANVNPARPHPRWSQATERMLGTGETRRTLHYNGYGEWVAKLYK